MGVTVYDYHLTSPFTNNNAGMCQWAFAKKNGHDYFIKQFLSPKYPTREAITKLSPTIVAAMKAEANDFYARRKVFYDKLLECRTGNVVVVQEFFREGECYYIVTDKVYGPFLTIEEISNLSEEKKRTLFKAILYSIIQIHERGIVHSDLKPENIMIKQTADGFCTAKLIDFDSGYFEHEVPEEIVGDQQYFSPEAVLRNDGRNVPIGVKSDIFALGLLFHKYWCGDFPDFNRAEYDSASIALLNHEELALHPALPEDIRDLIGRMLAKYQDNRPTAKEAWEYLDSNTLVSSGASTSDATLIKKTKEMELGFYIPQDDDL